MVNRVVVTCLLVLLMAPSVRADLFDRVVDEMFGDQRVRRSSYLGGGRSMMGGAVVQFPVSVTNPDPDHFRINTPCGSWSLTPKGVMQNLKEMLDPDRLLAALTSAIQDSIQNLIGAAVSKLSMMTVCYAVPTLCDLTKHMQAVAGQLHNIRSLSCQQLEGMVGNIATSLTAGRTARCVQAQIGQGMSLNVAQRICASGEWTAAPSNPGPDGGWGLFGDGGGSVPGGSAFPDDPMPSGTADPPGQRKEQKIISDTLKTALKDSTMGAAEKTELLEVQEHLIGDITVKDVTADGVAAPGADKPSETHMDPKMPEYKLHHYYASEFSRFDALMECAINTFGPHRDPTTDPTPSCGTLSYQKIDNTAATETAATAEELLRKVSIPGTEVPISGLQGLYEMKEFGEVSRYRVLKGKIVGSLALMRSVWTTRELRDELETGMMGKKELSEEERKQIEIRLRRLDREAERMVESRDAAERYIIPTFQTIVQDREMRRAVIARQVLGAGEDADRGGVMGGVWNPFGYKMPTGP